ncbi:hypothetical protein PV10_08065 [Exophiala mesophila]|uniref:Only prolin and serin are matching in the corresponding protein n=1 Tax=Exophiala mesophila TaxID=212818 RepID=A0A0D1WHT3_EXOME|nr:uncharacterized protein PV10_08065 [Exophiala mesophila]KIV88375.1 hypothetical protein PV10_08065 [Exophiala mesophila]
MESSYSTPTDAITPVSRSSTSSTHLSSPTASVFSRGHSSKGSGSSIASSPVQRDSIEMYGAPKRLEDVTEEPQERYEFAGYTLVNDRSYDLVDYDKAFADDHARNSPPLSPTQLAWKSPEDDDCSTTPSTPRHHKRPRSMDPTPLSTTHRLSSRLGSISRRWRNRSAAGPQLSIITHMNPPAARSGSWNEVDIISPALSAISKHESSIPHSPVQAMSSDTSLHLESFPVDIEQRPSQPEEEDTVHATTPLLPPIMLDSFQRELPIQSPLQSPSIAPTSTLIGSRTSLDTPLSCLPSPPLSTKPSMVSMHNRSRTSTITGELSPFHMLDDLADPWSAKLGHANFTIHPEPYVPDSNTLDSYIEFRENWNQARTNYAKHLARTAEHNGSTSKVYRLTEEKWGQVDNQWKRQHDMMKKILDPVLSRLSDGGSDQPNSTASSAVLEKSPAKVILPIIDDKSGKFPELGDMEIVGPMSVGPPRAMLDSHKAFDSRGQPTSPHKRSLFKALSELLRH